MRVKNRERAPPRADAGIVISRGNGGAQMSWSRRDRDYLSWATERSLIHVTICTFEPWAEQV
jgi:hypothetical protein